MEYSHSFRFIPWLLILIFSTTLASGSNTIRFPRLSIQPPKWRVQESNTAAAPDTSFLDEYELYEYNQTIDHFSFRPESFTKFKQRYVVNLKHWGGAKSKSPIFVYLGAEESVIEEVMVVGLMHENAPQFKAMIAFIEHRFYGESIPYGWPIGRALKHKEVRAYLSTAQVLADYAEVILHLKQIYSADLSPVVVFGGSYGGMLATWFRLKYPHVAMGALASSAPILHHVNDHYFRYMDRASQDYKDTSENCFWTIKKGFSEIANLGSQPNGLARLSKKFNFCSPFKKAMTLVDNVLVPVFRKATQYDNPPDYPVETACKAIDAAPKNAYVLDKLLAGLNALTDTFSQPKCVDPNDYETDQSDYFTSSYTFESCMELIHQEGVASHNSMFPYEPLSLKNFVEECVSNYRIPTRALYWFSQYYGGKHIQLDLRRFGSNIIFSNGLRDPWSLSGVLQNISDTLVAVTHPAAHCLDLQFSAKTDPKWLSGVRKKEMAIIREWLSTYYADLRSLHMA